MDGLISFFGNIFGSGAASSGASLLGTAANVGSLFSSGLQAFSSINAGKLQQQLFEIQAQQKRMEAQQVESNATFEQNAVKRKLLDDMSSTDAFFAGRGFSIGSGTARSAQIESRKRAGEDYNAIASKRDINTASIRGNASQLSAEGVYARSAGRMKAFEAIPGALKSIDSLVRGGMQRRSLLS